MTRVTPADRNQVRDLLERAEDQQLTRATYLESVAAWLAQDQADDPRREAALRFASQRADRSNALAVDRTLPTDLDEAARLLRATAEPIAKAPWLDTVLNDWPAPIAHEIARLLEELQGRPGPGSGPGDTRQLPNPDAALLQLRDSGEVLIKVAACILGGALMAAGGADGEWARRELFQRRLLLGIWVGLLREAAKWTLSAPTDGPVHAFAQACKKQLLPFANDFVELRNQTIGHGARALDPRETARLVTGLMAGGRVKRLNGSERSVHSLAGALAGLVEAGGFAGWTLAAVDGTERFDLSGAGAAERWLKDPRHQHHHDHSLPVELRLPDGATLSLAPLIAARICTQCGRRDLVIYDSLYDAHRGGRFDLVDYARGHKSRLWGEQATDLGEAIQGLDPRDAEALPEDHDTLALGQVMLALDRARVDRNYRSPAYLRQGLADWLDREPGGVYWLQAPAHIGKTTFIQGLAGDTEIEDEPIDPRFAPRAPGIIAAYYCRKEYRVGIAGLSNRLSDRLQALYDPSDTRRNEQPLPLTREQPSPTPAQFIA